MPIIIRKPACSATNAKSCRPSFDKSRNSVGCDRYLVVTRLEGQCKGTNQMLNGVGIVNHGTSLFSRTYLFANIRRDSNRRSHL